MGPKRLSRAEKKAATREALLDAAARVYAQRGLENASIEEICEQAGYSRGAFYSNFSDKRELFLEALDRHTQLALTHIAEGFGTGATLLERVANGAQAAERVVDEDPAWCRLYFEGWVLASRDKTFLTLYAQRYEGMRLALAAMIDGGGTDPNAATSEVAAGVLALFEGFVLQHVLDPAALPERFLGRSMALLLDGLERAV